MNLPDPWRTPVTLTGRVVRLEPLTIDHVPGLVQAGRDESTWRYMLYGNLSREPEMRAWVEDMLRRQSAGTDLPFAVRHFPSGRLAGATRYMELRPPHRALEIGGSWYGPEFRRTAVNTECKLLLLTYAFEVLGCLRVQFKCDLRNTASLRALERLGAVREGVLRSHLLLQDGTRRDSVYFSILDHEWAEVKARLEGRLLQVDG